MVSKQRILSMTVLMAAVSSVGIMTTLLSAAFAQEQNYNAILGGENEVPPNNSTAKGWAWFKPTNDTVAYQVNATGLNNVTAAHIHSGKVGVNGEVVVVLFESNNGTGPINGTFAQGNFTAADLKGPMQGKSISDLVRAMQNGESYTNVHTHAFSDGEIRGQISGTTTTNTTTTMNTTTTTTIK
jgi:CHRD domain